ncbi:hypothetical protein GN956_G19746 [Arapaima gigas]
MEVQLEEQTKYFAQIELKKPGSTENVVVFPVLNGSTECHTDSLDEETAECSQVGLTSANQTLTEDLSAAESSCLLTCQGLKPINSVETEASHFEAPSVASSASSFKKEASSRALPICTPPSTSTNQPHLLSMHSPSCSRLCEVEKKHVASGSSSNSQHSPKTSTSQIQRAAGDDLCASILLACLFCQLCDCFLTIAEGCQLCLSSLCSSFCCCSASLLDVTPHCTCRACLEPQSCFCGGSLFDCSIMDLCFHTTECLELGMEISQLLFH